MKNTLSPKVLLIADRVAKIPFAKSILKHVYYPYKEYLNKKRNAQFKKMGLQVIKEFDHCFEENNLFYTLAFGSMLGAVREKGFIKHDMDLDVFVWAEDYSDKIQLSLENSGFKLIHRFTVDGGSLAREETYVKYDVSIDIFYVYPPIDKYTTICDYKPFKGAVSWDDSEKNFGGLIARRFDIPVAKERIKTKFEDAELYVPINYDEFLRMRYGDTYMIPDPTWSNGDNPHLIVWSEKVAHYEHF